MTRMICQFHNRIALFAFTCCFLSAGHLFAQCGPTRVELDFESTDCLEVGTEVVATIWLRDANNPVLGGQFFVEYNPAVLGVVSVQPGEEPFILPLFTNTTVPGRIDYSVTIFPLTDPGTVDDTIMGYFRFTVLASEGDSALRFRLNDPPSPNQLLIGGAGLVPILDDGFENARNLRDFANLQRCFYGTKEEATEECVCLLTFGADNTLDLGDFWEFSQFWSAPDDATCE